MTAAIDPVALERELMQQWREAAQLDQRSDTTSDATQARVRAILSNLVLVTSTSQDFVRSLLDDFITDVCIGFPSRIFLVELGCSEKGDDISAAVASRCVLARSGAHVCSEEIRFSVQPPGIAATPNLLEALFVADAPRVLALPGDAIAFSAGNGEGNGNRPESAFVRLFRQVKQICDRVLFDSSHFVRMDHSMRVVRSGEERPLQDLNWARTERWRQLVAELFDAPALISILSDATRIELGARTREAGGRQFLCGDSLLAAGWLLQAFQWTPEEFSKKGSEAVLRCSSPSGDREMRWALSNPLSKPGESLAGVKVIFDGAGGKGEAFVSRDLQTRRAVTGANLSGAKTQGSPIVATRHVPFRAVPAEDLFLDTVVSSDSGLFEASLRHAEVIAKSWGEG